MCTLGPSLHAFDVIYTVDWCSITDYIVTGAGDNAIRLFKLDVGVVV